MAGAPNRGGQNQVPEGAQIGLGVRTAAVRNLHIQGALTQHDQQVRPCAQRPRLVSGGRQQRRAFLYACRRLQQERHRADRDRGRLRRAAGNHGPAQRHEVVDQRDGPGLRSLDANANLQLLGQLTIGAFVNEVGLEPLGGNLYRETLASGPVTLGVPVIPVSARSIRAIWRTPTSIRSRRSPS